MCATCLFHGSEKTAYVGIVPAVASFVQLSFVLAHHEVVPSGTAFGVEAGCFGPVSAFVSTGHTLVETFEVEADDTFTPKLDTFLQEDFVDDIFSIGSLAGVLREGVGMHQRFAHLFLLSGWGLSHSFSFDKIHFLNTHQRYAYSPCYIRIIRDTTSGTEFQRCEV